MTWFILWATLKSLLFAQLIAYLGLPGPVAGRDQRIEEPSRIVEARLRLLNTTQTGHEARLQGQPGGKLTARADHIARFPAVEGAGAFIFNGRIRQRYPRNGGTEIIFGGGLLPRGQQEANLGAGEHKELAELPPQQHGQGQVLQAGGFAALVAAETALKTQRALRGGFQAALLVGQLRLQAQVLAQRLTDKDAGHDARATLIGRGGRERAGRAGSESELEAKVGLLGGGRRGSR